MKLISFTSRLLGTSALVLASGIGAAAMAQEAATAADAQVAVAPQSQVIQSISVVGTQRLEPQTVRSYIKMRTGQPWSDASADQALKDLFATELFADVSIRNNNGAVVIEVRENPVVNRIILEGNKKIKNDKIVPEIKLAPRQIYSRSKVRADVARIVELYKRQGRFAATVEPKQVQLDQNRVDIVFEITEGPKSKVRQINIIGNQEFSDSKLRSEMVTKQARFFRIFSSGTSYDPDRLAFDQQKLRQFYLTEGYADFRVVSAVAELTPDKQDFIITYVVEEGERYKFGDVTVDSQIRDFDSEVLAKRLPMETGDWYNAKQVEDTVEALSESAGLFGYAFAQVNPRFNRDKDTKTMGIEFQIEQSPRVFVERIDINGNTQTVDKVIRREFRLNEGDAFDSFRVKRTANRIKSLGYFQDDLEVEQAQGSAPDRIVLTTNVEERPTGELSLSAGFSSIENFIFQGSIRNRNFRGMGQELRTSISYSNRAQSIELGFTEPYLFDRSISLSGDIFRRDLNAFNFIGNERNTTYEQNTTGFQVRTGVPINEFLFFQARYGLSLDDVSLSRDRFFTDRDGNGTSTCDPFLAGRFLCDAIGKRTSSTLGATLLYDNRDNRLRPTRGHQISGSLDFAGLGGDVKYLRGRLNASKHWRLFNSGFIFSVSGEGGYIKSLENRTDDLNNAIEDVRLVDRFYLGEPQIRGFDIRGVGPRVLRFTNVDVTDAMNPTVVREGGRRAGVIDDAIGGRAYYLGRAELEIPLGSGAKELGLRPSIFADVGAVFGVRRPNLTSLDDFFNNDPDGNDMDDGNGVFANQCLTPAGVVFASESVDITDPNNTPTDPTDDISTPTGRFDACPANSTGNIRPFTESFVGDTWKPRVSVGFGVNWNSPFGPFRIDIAKALIKQDGDDTKLITFNVGTQF